MATTPTASMARLLQQSSVYALGNLLLKASGLVLAPLYLNTALLSQLAYGQLVLLDATAQLLLPLLGLGLPLGLLKFSTDPAQRAHQEALPFTVLSVTSMLSLGVVVVSWWGAPLLNQWLGWSEGVELVRLFGIYLAAKLLSGVPLAFLRLREQTGWYTTAVLAEALLLIGGVYYFLVHQRLGLVGVLLAMVLSAGLSMVVLMGSMLRSVPRRWDRRLLAALVRFGLPLALSGVVLPVLHVGDRYLLNWLATTETVAVYGWATRLSGVLNMLLVQGFQLAFVVIGLKALGEQPTGEAFLHRQTFRHYSIWGSWMVLALSLSAYDVTALLATDAAYLKADPLVLPLSLGYLGYGLYIIFVNVLYAAGDSRFIAWNVVAATALNVLLNLWWIPRWGAMGAAWATLVAYSLLAAGAAWQAQRLRPTVYPWAVLAGAVALALGLAWLGQGMLSWPTLLRLLGRSVLLVLYLPLVVALRFYRWEELREGWRWVRKRLPMG